MKNKSTIIALGWIVSTILVTTGCGQLDADDSSSESAMATFSVTPSATTLGSGENVLISGTGGVQPYYYTLVSGVGGSISSPSGYSTTFTAGTTSGTVQVRVNDSAGEVIDVTISIDPTGCGGSFIVNIAGTSGSMIVAEDGSGTIAGYIDLGGKYTPLSGTCANGAINFTDPSSNSTYTGTYSVTSGTVGMSGTVTSGGTTHTWTAQ